VHLYAKKNRPLNAKRASGDIISHSHSNSVDVSMNSFRTQLKRPSKDTKLEDELALR